MLASILFVSHDFVVKKMKAGIRKCFLKNVNTLKKNVIKYISDGLKFPSDDYEYSDADEE